jgi:CopG family transcriptional regulator/antitoxin EndoAI
MPTRTSAKSTKSASKKSPAKPRKSKVYTISLPPDLAARAEAIAQSESRTMSEVFREAFREYETDRILEGLREAAEYGATRKLHGYTEEDVPRLVREVRAEMRAERERKARKAG